MAEETGLKNYTGKLKIGGIVYYLKDIDASNILTTLNGSDTVSGSILNSIKLYAKDGEYAGSTLGTALANVEDKVRILNGEKTVTGSVAFQIYNNSKDAIYSIVPEVTREATQEDVNAGTASAVGEIIVVTPAKVTTIQEAIENAANSIGNLTVNGKSPDEDMNILLTAADINRTGLKGTVESTLTAAEGKIDVLVADVNTEGSVDYKIYNKAEKALYKTLDDGTVVTIEAGIKAIEDRVTALETSTAANIESINKKLDTLNGDKDVVDSVKYNINQLAKDAIFRFAGSDSDVTIGAAIQSNYDLITANKKGSFKIVDEINTTGGSYTVGGTVTSISEADYGTIFLVNHVNTEENAAGEKVAAHYDEYIVINLGTEETPQLKLEKIGDTEISLDGYATQTWVNENAKDAVYSQTQAYKYVGTFNGTDYYVDHGEAHNGDTAYTVTDGTINAVADKIVIGENGSISIGGNELSKTDGINDYVDNTPLSIAGAIDKLFNELNSHIRTLDSAIRNINATIASTESTINTTISNLDKEVVKTVNNVKLDEGTNNVTIKATDIEYSNSMTVAEGLDALAISVVDEAERAKKAEEGIIADVADLQSKVTGKTVKSVNGQFATEENGGNVTIDDSMIEHSPVTPAEYYTANDQEVLDGLKVVGDVKVAAKDAVSVREAINNNTDRLSKIEFASFEQTINGIKATVTGNFSDGIKSDITLDAHDVKMDKGADGSISVYDKIEGILNSNANAVTNVDVKEGTGTWVVDPDDAEMLDWVDVTLATSNATFLVPSAE